MKLDPLRLAGARFVDSADRQVMLRGVNLGGDCKVPYPDGGTETPSDFADHREVSFIGRPFPLEEADEHLGRLKHWGFNLLRLLTTWEAVEHAGPGLYDEAYLDYFAEVCRRAGDHGLYVFVDFHEDVWSRMTGGDGAPGWTFDVAGLDFTRFHAAGAAHVMQARYDYARGGRQDAYPQMTWGTNHRLPASAIMWSLFWGGRHFTPQLKVGGVNIQDFLQDRYVGAMQAVAKRVKDLPNVIGFDTLNEPGVGWMGERLSYRHIGPSEDNPSRARPGLALSALDALAAAQGLTVIAPMLTRDPRSAATTVTGEGVINPDGVSIWANGGGCPFEAAGAYRVKGGRAIALDEEHFRMAQGRRLTVSDDGFGPLFHKVAAATRAENPDWAVFAELDAFGAAGGRPFPSSMPERSVNASHWYDSTTLYLKTFNPQSAFDLFSGEEAKSPDEIRARYIRQMAFRARPAETFPGGAPTLIGEFGIPYDLDDGEAYEAWAAGRRDPAIWSNHAKALELMYDALDELQLHSAQWNYTATNRNDLMIGDRWNQEDLSIFSRDQQDDPADPDSGGRAVLGFCRPYAQRLQGELVRMRFNADDNAFDLEIEADPDIDQPTVIYLPRLRFPTGVAVASSGPAIRAAIDGAAQTVRVWALARGRLTLRLTARS